MGCACQRDRTVLSDRVNHQSSRAARRQQSCRPLPAAAPPERFDRRASRRAGADIAQMTCTHRASPHRNPPKRTSSRARYSQVERSERHGYVKQSLPNRERASFKRMARCTHSPLCCRRCASYTGSWFDLVDPGASAFRGAQTLQATAKRPRPRSVTAPARAARRARRISPSVGNRAAPVDSSKRALPGFMPGDQPGQRARRSPQEGAWGRTLGPRSRVEDGQSRGLDHIRAGAHAHAKDEAPLHHSRQSFQTRDWGSIRPLRLLVDYQRFASLRGADGTRPAPGTRMRWSGSGASAEQPRATCERRPLSS